MEILSEEFEESVGFGAPESPEERAEELEEIKAAMIELARRGEELVRGTEAESYYRAYVLGHVGCEEFGFLGKGIAEHLAECVELLGSEESPKCELDRQASELGSAIQAGKHLIPPGGLILAEKRSGWRLRLFRSGHLREDLKNSEGVLMDYRLLSPRGALLRYDPDVIKASLRAAGIFEDSSPEP